MKVRKRYARSVRLNRQRRINQVRRKLSVNSMPNVVGFLEAWDDSDHEENKRDAPLYVTPAGNINSTGVIADYRGHTLSRFHLQFRASLESGVEQLVWLIISKFNWITYTSCEGHYYEDPAIIPVERRVGIIPRSSIEARTIKNVLRTASISVNSHYRLSPAYIEALMHTLESDGQVYQVIDIFFRRRLSASWGQYFAHLDEIYNALLEHLAQIQVH